MQIEGIDHLYVETRSFEAAVAFWQGLGFELVGRWGTDGHKAGRLRAGDATIVLAESDDPHVAVHFKVTDAGDLPLEPTHWGTRWHRLTDPDGHGWVLEET